MQQKTLLKRTILSPGGIPTLSKDKDEQLKMAHKVVDVLDRGNGKICVVLLRYSADKRVNFYAQVRFFTRKKEHEKFQQTVFVKNKLEQLIYLLDIMNDKAIANKINCNVL